MKRIQFTPRKILFKAWNTETRLLMRLHSIECVKGELFRKNHILLQFTGLYDKKNEEIYEMDVLLIGSEKFIVRWDTDQNGWSLNGFSNATSVNVFNRASMAAAVRICNYFESR